MPVLRGARLVGIITESDIFQAFIEATGVREKGIRITFNVENDEEFIGTLLDISRCHEMRLTSFISLHHGDKRSGDAQRFGVVRLVGRESDNLLEEIWKSGHRVFSVLRTN